VILERVRSLAIFFGAIVAWVTDPCDVVVATVREPLNPILIAP
jgi:hypothetical protein